MGLTVGMRIAMMVIAALVSVLVGIGAGLLARGDGTSPRASVLRAGGAFAVAMTLLVGVLTAVGAFSQGSA
ncbi:hypothetical protein [Kitasatospora sp. NPDC058190]|uniref:hypothetical protein n=1 Tax=Kitasatospora sp. NPDC058190 TaxID=3346371 RepID=UPI0036D994E5